MERSIHYAQRPLISKALIEAVEEAQQLDIPDAVIAAVVRLASAALAVQQGEPRMEDDTLVERVREVAAALDVSRRMSDLENEEDS